MEIRDVGNLFPRLGKTNRERERLYHGMVTIGQRVRLLFYRPGRPFSKNIPFSIENERVIMVHEEEEKKRGGDINERDRTCIELTDYNVHNPNVRWRFPTHGKQQIKGW